MNDDFTKDDEQEVDFDPKKIKDVEEDDVLVDDPLLDDDLGEDDADDYTFDGDSDDDEDF